MQFLAYARSGKCNFWQVHVQGNAISGKCTFREMYDQENVVSAWCFLRKCNFWKVFFVEVYGIRMNNSFSCINRSFTRMNRTFTRMNHSFTCTNHSYTRMNHSFTRMNQAQCTCLITPMQSTFFGFFLLVYCQTGSSQRVDCLAP